MKIQAVLFTFGIFYGIIKLVIQPIDKLKIVEMFVGTFNMNSSMVIIIALLISIAGCVFCPFWIKNSRGRKDKIRGIFCLVVSIIMLPMFLWAVIYDNNLLWYGQHAQNSHIEMNIETTNVEQSSFIYLIEQFDAETSVEDVIRVMGTDYEVSTDYGYEMKYTTSKYTLDGSESTFISFKFNKRKTEILSIKWAHRSPSQGMFTQTLRYLESNAFGKAVTSTANKADWKGLHLEDTGYFLLLMREF